MYKVRAAFLPLHPELECRVCPKLGIVFFHDKKILKFVIARVWKLCLQCRIAKCSRISICWISEHFILKRNKNDVWRVEKKKWAKIRSINIDIELQVLKYDRALMFSRHLSWPLSATYRLLPSLFSSTWFLLRRSNVLHLCQRQR